MFLVMLRENEDDNEFEIDSVVRRRTDVSVVEAGKLQDESEHTESGM